MSEEKKLNAKINEEQAELSVDDLQQVSGGVTYNAGDDDQNISLGLDFGTPAPDCPECRVRMLRQKDGKCRCVKCGKIISA